MTFSLKRITDEIRLTNTLLESVDGKKQRTFAFTCGDTKVGGRFAAADRLRASWLGPSASSRFAQRRHGAGDPLPEAE